MQIIYNIIIRFYCLFILLGSTFNRKARLWIRGRRNWEKRLVQNIHSGSPFVWFHAASLGEFEQGRPVIETLRKKFPHLKILLTFFSPSGYETRKNYEGADYVCYLPADTPRNAKRFIEIVKPEFALFIKYEYWFNYLSEMHKNEIPVYIVSAIFRPKQIFFRWYGTWFRNQLKNISMFFVQNEFSFKLLNNAGIEQVKLSGDTRFDRVASIVSLQNENPTVEAFSSGYKIILGGSTWPPDEKLLESHLKKAGSDIKLIIAPHEIHEERIRSIEHLFGNFNTQRYSRATSQNVQQCRVLIIDGIGFLSGLYRYCHVACIGGGFGKGIHNILEAVTFGKPVIFGPEYKKFDEAVALIKKGGAFKVSNEVDHHDRLNQILTDDAFHNKASLICRQFIANNTGATKIILDFLAIKLKANQVCDGSSEEMLLPPECR
jgi:3-deoxy-D-manno-octulosonic-acid transferase